MVGGEEKIAMLRHQRYLLLLCLCLLVGPMRSQEVAALPGTLPDPVPNRHPSDRSVNFGIKGGFTSALFIVSDLIVNGVRIDQVQNNYKIGYFGSFFLRINRGRHFFQPEVSYVINRCEISLQKPQTDGDMTTLSQEASVRSSLHSIDLPLLYGYNIIKQGPYGLALFGGPKLRYLWKEKCDLTFRNFDQQDIQETLYPLNAALTLGVAVTIAPIFFDFRYDIGLHNISKKVTYTSTDASQLRFHRRDNILSFSLGAFF